MNDKNQNIEILFSYSIFDVSYCSKILSNIKYRSFHKVLSFFFKCARIWIRIKTIISAPRRFVSSIRNRESKHPRDHPAVVLHVYKTNAWHLYYEGVCISGNHII